MSTIKKTVSIKKNVVKEASALDANFSAVVEAALVDYIHHRRVEKAMQSFGKWGDREKESVDLVRDLRKNDDRKHVTRSGSDR